MMAERLDGTQMCLNDNEHDWQLTEHGYSRSWSTTFDFESKQVVGDFTGSDDWSGDGDGKMLLECPACGDSIPVPEDWEVEYT